MNASANAPAAERRVIESFDTEFSRLHKRSCAIVETTPFEILYQQTRPTPVTGTSATLAESILRSAAAVEQTFGGITANLWDDPFEWTLAETLSTPERMIGYLREVEDTRRRAFACFSEDTDLLKEVLVPSGETQALITLLLETLVRASYYQARANGALKMLFNVTPGGFMI